LKKEERNEREECVVVLGGRHVRREKEALQQSKRKRKIDKHNIKQSRFVRKNGRREGGKKGGTGVQIDD
jgi:hypothetical protein